MPNQPDFDLTRAHRYFAAECFNRAWDLMDKPERSPQEDEEMLRLSLASQYHWTQRDDFTPTSQSVGFWQTARIYAMLGQVENARRYGELSLQASREEGVPPFYLGYAYEALARAELAAGDRDMMDAYLAQARKAAGAVSDSEARKQLLDDLESIK